MSNSIFEEKEDEQFLNPEDSLSVILQYLMTPVKEEDIKKED